MPTLYYFPCPGPEGQRESAYPMGTYLHTCGRAHGGPGDTGQATVGFKGSSITTHHPWAMLPSPLFNAVPGLPLAVPPAPWWWQTVFPWSSGLVLPSGGELASWYPAIWSGGKLQVSLPFLFLSLSFALTAFLKLLCEARPITDLALAPWFHLTFLLQMPPKVLESPKLVPSERLEPAQRQS